MDIDLIHQKADKAFSLICRDDDLQHIIKREYRRGVLTLTITVNERQENDMALVAQYQSAKMRLGHEHFKRRYPGLTDDMIGRRFKLWNNRFYVYLGCVTSRPKYPLALIEITGDGGQHRLVKGPVDTFDHMISQMPELKKAEVEDALNPKGFDDSIKDGGFF